MLTSLWDQTGPQYATSISIIKPHSSLSFLRLLYQALLPIEFQMVLITGVQK